MPPIALSNPPCCPASTDIPVSGEYRNRVAIPYLFGDAGYGRSDNPIDAYKQR